MPIDYPSYATAPENADRSAQKDTFARQGAVFVVDVPIAPGVVRINMQKIGLSGRHVRISSTAGLTYFFEEKKGTPTLPTAASRATFDVDGNITANPATQAASIAAGGSVRRYSPKRFPILALSGVAATVVTIEDATI